jgi:hypothetical protein
MIWNVPEWPLYVLAGVQSVKYLWQFWQTRSEHIPTNYILLGKSFSWALLCSVYIWASVTTANIYIVRNVVRLANILWILMDLYYFWVVSYFKRKYKQ